MSPTSISGGGKLLTGGELISPASCDAELVPVGKHQEEDLSSTNLEQRCYNRRHSFTERNLLPCLTTQGHEIMVAEKPPDLVIYEVHRIWGRYIVQFPQTATFTFAFSRRDILSMPTFRTYKFHNGSPSPQKSQSSSKLIMLIYHQWSSEATPQGSCQCWQEPWG